MSPFQSSWLYTTANDPIDTDYSPTEDLWYKCFGWERYKFRLDYYLCIFSDNGLPLPTTVYWSIRTPQSSKNTQ